MRNLTGGEAWSKNEIAVAMLSFFALFGLRAGEEGPLSIKRFSPLGRPAGAGRLL